MNPLCPTLSAKNLHRVKGLLLSMTTVRTKRVFPSAVSSALVVSAPSQNYGSLLSWSEIDYFMDHCPGLSTAIGVMKVITHTPPLILSHMQQKTCSPILSFSEIRLPALSCIAGTTWIHLRDTRMRCSGRFWRGHS